MIPQLAAWLAAKAQPRRGMSAGADEDAPGGAFARFLTRLFLHPDQFAKDALAALRRAAAAAAPWAIGSIALVILLIAGFRLLRRLRDARGMQSGTRLRILPPPEIDPAGGDVLWSALHGLIRPRLRALLEGQPALVWEVVARAEQMEISVFVPGSVPLETVERAIAAAWRGASLIRLPDDATTPGGTVIRTTRLVPARPEWFPLGSGPDTDPLRVVLGSMATIAEDESALLQFICRPASSADGRRLIRRFTRQRSGRRVPFARTPRSSSPHTANDPTQHAEEREVHHKAAAALYRCDIRVAVGAPSRARAKMRAHSIASSFAIVQGTNRLAAKRMPNGAKTTRARRSSRGYLLSVPEVACLATLPQSPVLGLDVAGARVISPSRSTAQEGRALGVANGVADKRSVAISLPDARHHVHVVGQTGSGKSTLLANLILQDARAGRGAVVIDPKGDLVEAVLERLPSGAEERTCLIDPCDMEGSVGLNVLAGTDADLIADQLVAVFKRIYDNHWGPRSDDLLRSSCLTLAKIPGATLAEVPLLLTHADWRRAIRARLSDPALRLFWELYDAKPEARRQEDTAPLMNKLRAFLLRGSIRAIVGQSEPKRDVEELLEDGGLLLVRVPKGLIGEDTSKMLGALVVARVWQAAMRRARVPEHARRDLALYVDEVHNYLQLPRSFEDLLAEARGYGLSLFLAHQHLGQLPREMREGLAANALTKVVFGCSPSDARIMEEHFEPVLSRHDLSHLPPHAAACRPCVGGGAGRAFTFETVPLGEGSLARAEQVRIRNRELFGVPRQAVETKIRERQRRPESTLLPLREVIELHPPAHSVDQSPARSVARPSLIGSSSSEGAGDRS